MLGRRFPGMIEGEGGKVAARAEPRLLTVQMHRCVAPLTPVVVVLGWLQCRAGETLPPRRRIEGEEKKSTLHKAYMGRASHHILARTGASRAIQARPTAPASSRRPRALAAPNTRRRHGSSCSSNGFFASSWNFFYPSVSRSDSVTRHAVRGGDAVETQNRFFKAK